MKRRDFLKRNSQLGITLGGLGYIGQSTSAEYAGEILSDWDCDKDCPKDTVATENVGLESNRKNPDGAFSVHWFESFSNNGTYYHKFAVSGAAAGGTSNVFNPLHGQKYKVHSLSNIDNISGSTNNNLYGQYPAEDDSLAPGWAQPILKQTIGALDPGNAAGWFMAVDDALNKKLGDDPDRYDRGAYQNGFKYQNTSSYFSHMSECCFFQRFDVEAGYKSRIRVGGGFGEQQERWPFKKTHFKEVEMDLRFFGTTGPIVESLTEKERKKAGIKRVPDDAGITRTVDGKEIKPDYIFTKPPVTVEKINRKTTVEELEE